MSSFRIVASAFGALLLAALSARASLDPSKALTQYVHRSWQADSGLPQNSVLAIAQTPDGYVWLGTEDGLVRFDGVRFTLFDQRAIPGLRSNEIRALLVDHAQNLWIGTHGGGLTCLSHGKFKVLDARSGLSSDSILALYEDRVGALWIGTDGGGLIQLKDGKFRTFRKTDGLADDAVFSISGDDAGTLWIGTHGGLSRFAEGKFTTLGTKDGLDSDYIRCTYVDRHRNVWIGTNDGGVNRLAMGAIAHFARKDGLTSDTILSIYEDRAGTMWFGTLDGGLNRFSNGKFASLTQKEGLSSVGVWSILEGREGELWVGGAGGGLDCLKDAVFTTIGTREGLPTDLVLPVYEDRDGALWMGSDHGLTKWQDGHMTLFTTQDGLPDNLVFSITQDIPGTIWAGTSKGLAKLENGRFVTTGFGSGIPNNFVMSTYADRDGTLWFGNRAGLHHFDGKAFTTYNTHNGLTNNFVLSIYQASDGAIWVGTNGGGLNKLENGKFSSYTTHDGLSNDIVWSIHGEPDGTLWLGTNGGGLNRFRAGKFTNYTTANGLFDDVVFEILDDRLGQLWMSSDKGVFAVRKDELEALAQRRRRTISSTVYGINEGMRSRECNGGFQPAGWRTKRGLLCFPTVKGLVMVDPARLARRQAPPLVAIERVVVDQNEIDMDAPADLPPGRGKLDFQFTGLSFEAPEKIRFRYILEGFDKEWTGAGTRRTAYYTNIPPGHYRFRVMASNQDQVWSPAGASVSLTLEPHFYQTWTFFLFLIGVVAAVGYGAHKLHVRHLRQRQFELLQLVDARTFALGEREAELRQSRDQLEIRVQERTNELVATNKSLEEEVATRREAELKAEAANHAKSDFLTNMSHEIRTPINGILGMTEIVLDSNLNHDQRESLEIVKTSADSLLTIVNDILDFSRIEARRMRIEPVPFNLRTWLDELVRSLGPSAHHKNLSLSMHADEALPTYVIGDAIRLQQVLLNLVNNAVKFTADGGVFLSIAPEELHPDDALLRFSVTDTGIGISEDKQKTIFEAFAQADNSSTRRYGGTGLGLTISSQLVALMGGKMWVESQVGAGSTFHFTVQLEIAHLSSLAR